MKDSEIIAFLESRYAEAVRSRDFTVEWYACRLEALKQLCKDHGIWPEAAAIIANGSKSSREPPPDWSGLLQQSKHTSDSMEKALRNLVNICEKNAELGIDGGKELREARQALRFWDKEKAHNGQHENEGKAVGG